MEGVMLFEARDICKSYKNVPVFSGFSLKVEKGDMIALVGKRRQGKTTLMQMLAGIIPVDSGEIYYEDKPVGRRGHTAGLCKLRRNKIGYLTTEAILMPDLTVYDNLLLAMNHKRGSTKAKKAKAKEVLKNLGLKGKGRYFPKELTTLEKQKVCVARAIINEPELLLCDEPTDILEGYGAEQMMDILEILNSAGYTIVLSTHSKRIAGRCRKVYPIHEGIDLTGLIREGGLVQETGEFEAVPAEELVMNSGAAAEELEAGSGMSGAAAEELEAGLGMSGAAAEAFEAVSDGMEASSKVLEDETAASYADESTYIRNDGSADDSKYADDADDAEDDDDEVYSVYYGTDDDEVYSAYYGAGADGKGISGETEKNADAETEELPEIDLSDLF